MAFTPKVIHTLAPLKKTPKTQLPRLQRVALRFARRQRRRNHCARGPARPEAGATSATSRPAPLRPAPRVTPTSGQSRHAPRRPAQRSLEGCGAAVQAPVGRRCRSSPVSRSVSPSVGPRRASPGTEGPSSSLSAPALVVVAVAVAVVVVSAVAWAMANYIHVPPGSPEVPKLDVTVPDQEERRCREGALRLLQHLRPHWDPREVTLQVGESHAKHTRARAHLPAPKGSVMKRGLRWGGPPLSPKGLTPPPPKKRLLSRLGSPHSSHLISSHRPKGHCSAPHPHPTPPLDRRQGDPLSPLPKVCLILAGFASSSSSSSRRR